MIRIGFLINFSKNNWLGGYNYFINLLFLLKKFSYQKIEPVIITDKIKRLDKTAFKHNFEILEHPYFSSSNLLKRLSNKILIILFGKNFFIDKFLLKNKINIMSHSGYYGKKSEIISFQWIPDFQEFHYPKYFSFKAIFLRKLNIIMGAKHSTKIILSSNAVKRDLKKINFAAYKKSEVLNHANSIPEFKEIVNPRYLQKKYNLKKGFFYLPNQYWVHKNHIVVLKALRIVREKYKNIQIISTGNLHDHRNPDHYKFIKNYIKKNNLENNYIILGIIPMNEVISLMYYSKALINPSKSEGLSNSVEQAKLLNKTVILSNNPVHKEQKSKNFIFFNQDNDLELSSILKKLYLKDIKYVKSKKKYNKLKKIEMTNQKKFSKKFEKFILKNTRHSAYNKSM